MSQSTNDWNKPRQKNKKYNKKTRFTEKEISFNQILDQGYCIFHFVGKCQGKCRLKHLESTDRIFHLIKDVLMNPSNYLNFDKKRFLDNFDCQNKSSFFTICFYSARGVPCLNSDKGRFQKCGGYHVCYPELQKCKHKITFSLHTDFFIDLINSLPLAKHSILLP